MQVEHVFLFRKRQALTHQAADRLPQRVVEPFNVVGQPASFSRFWVPFFRHTVISPPKIAEALAAQILIGQLAP